VGSIDKAYIFTIKHIEKYLTGELKYFVVGASSGAMGELVQKSLWLKSEAGEDTVAYW